MKNWKTNLAGIIGGIASLGAIAGTMAGYLPPKYAAIAVGIATTATAIGNLMSKDYDTHSTATEVQVATVEKEIAEVK
jgi:hypothetical protein